MKTHRVVELLGDGISAELSRSVHALAAELPCKIEFLPIDLSLGNRQRRGAVLYDQAAAAMRQERAALKYPTETPPATGDSPNNALRERCDFSVIHRPIATVPGIENNFASSIDVDVVRIATGGTYADPGRMRDPDTAVSERVIERRPSTLAARFAFQLARSRGTHVVSTSKYTIQRSTDGLFEDAVSAVAKDYPDVKHRRELFDSLLAGLVMKPHKYAVIVTPNEYGDFLSDLACGLIGSIGIGDSSSYAYDARGNVTVAMFDPAGGTAPDIAGQNLCNPTAALLSLANLVTFLGDVDVGRRLRRAVLDAIGAKRSTRDIGGTLSTTEFTEEVASRFRGTQRG